MYRRSLLRLAPLVLGTGLLWSSAMVHAAGEAPDAFIKRLSDETLEAIKSDPSVKGGQFAPVMALVDRIIMPNVDFRRMTASATGPAWRKASGEQQQRLQDEFKTLLVRTYSGALKQVSDQTVEVRPLRGTPGNEVLVRTLVRGKGDPVQLDYRLERTSGGAGWKIYDLNVAGVWFGDNYRSQFAQVINGNGGGSQGVDALIRQLGERNKANAASGG